MCWRSPRPPSGSTILYKDSQDSEVVTLTIMDSKKSSKTKVKDYASECTRPEVPTLRYTLESPEKLLKLLMAGPVPDQLNQNICGYNRNQVFKAFQITPICSQVCEPLLYNAISMRARSLSPSQVCCQHLEQNLPHGMCMK